VKLLFDHNLSPRLIATLRHDYPDSQHVREVGLKDASDAAVWQYAAQHDCTIVTKDADFHQRSFLFGHPPKVIWIRAGNCSTDMIEAILRRHRAHLNAFAADTETAFLELE
jgi:predicted nuclease of predicted toxin-antitoxin system